MKAHIYLSAAVLATLPAQAANVAAFNQFETDSEGWSNNADRVNRVADVGDDGAAGVLNATSTGTGNRGSRFLLVNRSSDWTGDYAGIEGVNLLANNQTGVGSTITLRLAVDGPGGWFVTAGQGVSSSADGSANWTPLSFSLDSTALTFVSGTGTGVLADTLGNVRTFEILGANPITLPGVGNGGLLQGARIAADISFDDIGAVPEPSSALLGLLASLGLLRRRR